MEKAKISVIQLFSMMFLFDMGTTLVESYGISAQKDVWLSVLLGMFGGIVFFLFTTFYFVNIPIYPLLDILEKYLVNTWGGLLACYTFSTF